MKAAYYVGKETITVGEGTIVAPCAGEVRLKVAYCGVCGTDVHIFHGAMDKRVSVPQVIGHEMSGEIAELGAEVEGLAIGDRVVVRPLDTRNSTAADRRFEHIGRGLKFMGIDSPGALQESWTVPSFTVHKLPPGTDLKVAALTEPLAVACHDVRMAGLKPGDLAVVLGAGPIGVLIALVARQAGAHVVISEVSDFRIASAEKLGLTVLNPQKEDLGNYVKAVSNDAGADVVFEVSGAKAALLSAPDLLAIRGRLLLVAIYPQPAEMNLFQFFWKELSLQGARVYEGEDYEQAIRLVAEGTLPLNDLISKVLPLDKLQEAFHTLATDQTAMKILIKCASSPSSEGDV